MHEERVTKQTSVSFHPEIPKDFADQLLDQLDDILTHLASAGLRVSFGLKGRTNNEGEFPAQISLGDVMKIDTVSIGLEPDFKLSHIRRTKEVLEGHYYLYLLARNVERYFRNPDKDRLALILDELVDEERKLSIISQANFLHAKLASSFEGKAGHAWTPAALVIDLLCSQILCQRGFRVKGKAGLASANVSDFIVSSVSKLDDCVYVELDLLGMGPMIEISLNERIREPELTAGGLLVFSQRELVKFLLHANANLPPLLRLPPSEIMKFFPLFLANLLVNHKNNPKDLVAKSIKYNLHTWIFIQYCYRQHYIGHGSEKNSSETAQVLKPSSFLERILNEQSLTGSIEAQSKTWFIIHHLRRLLREPDLYTLSLLEQNIFGAALSAYIQGEEVLWMTDAIYVVGLLLQKAEGIQGDSVMEHWQQYINDVKKLGLPSSDIEVKRTLIRRLFRPLFDLAQNPRQFKRRVKQILDENFSFSICPKEEQEIRRKVERVYKSVTRVIRLEVPSSFDPQSNFSGQLLN